MARKKKCPEFENHERWLVAFADMMTLLFALFVVLYAIASVNTAKVKQVSQSMQAAFGIKEDIPREDGGIPVGPSFSRNIFKYLKGNTSREQILMKMVRQRVNIIAAQAELVQQKISERLYGTKQFPSTEQKPIDRVVYVSRDAEGVRVTFLSRVIFDPGSYVVNDKTKKILSAVAEVLSHLNRVVRVEGHTDNLPFEKNGMTNWELSSLRATAVARFMVETGKFRPGTIYAAGFGDTRPITGNDTPEDRALNRRVDVKILYDNPSDYIPPDDNLNEEDKPNKE